MSYLPFLFLLYDFVFLSECTLGKFIRKPPLYHLLPAALLAAYVVLWFAISGKQELAQWNLLDHVRIVLESQRLAEPLRL